jgi:chemotaxis protein methyltransferase CheR
VRVEVSALEMPLVSSYVHEVSGIVIEPSKAYLVETRLGPLVQQRRLGGYADLVARAKQDGTGALQKEIIDAITTNETSFFRDQHPFELLVHKLIPDVMERQHSAPRPRLDIWCAAASTGQEIYSIAIVLQELLFDLSRYWIRILGTDISEAALARASRGHYSAFEVSRGLEQRRRDRFFLPDGAGWRIRDPLRSVATFRPLNLLERFRHVGSYDIIFCRNVAIYFSAQNRASLFHRLADQLRPGGVLVVGSTESLHGLTPRLSREEFHGSVFYRKTNERAP